MNELHDADYKPDFEILDRYINYSAELLRLSLLGIGGFGTFLLLRYEKETSFLLSNAMKCFFFASIIFFGLSAAFALGHRFCASDSMSYHIAYLRKTDVADKRKEKEGRTKMLKLSGNLLQWNAILFGVGVICFAVAIFLILFS